MLAGPQALQTSAERRRELSRDIVAAAYLRGDFVLSSGRHSEYYLDKYLFETKPTILRRLATFLAARVPPRVDRLAGPQLGAVALTAALSLETGLPFVVARENPSGRGRTLEGELHPGERVLVIEDVVSSGQRALLAARGITQCGAEVVGVMAVVDRLQGAADLLGSAGIPFESLFDVAELLPQTNDEESEH